VNILSCSFKSALPLRKHTRFKFNTASVIMHYSCDKQKSRTLVSHYKYSIAYTRLIKIHVVCISVKSCFFLAKRSAVHVFAVMPLRAANNSSSLCCRNNRWCEAKHPTVWLSLLLKQGRYSIRVPLHILPT